MVVSVEISVFMIVLPLEANKRMKHVLVERVEPRASTTPLCCGGTLIPGECNIKGAGVGRTGGRRSRGRG